MLNDLITIVDAMFFKIDDMAGGKTKFVQINRG